MVSRPVCAVLFDWDRTLVDSFPIIEASINATFLHMEAEGFPAQEPVDITSRPTVFMGTSHLLYERYGGDDWRVAADILVVKYRELITTELAMLDGARETLVLLEEHDIPMAVVTNKYENILREEAEFLGVDRKFAALVGRTPERGPKPKTDIVDEALRQLHLPSSIPIYLVGDGVVDFAVARRVRGYQCKPIIFSNAALSGIYSGEQGVHTGMTATEKRELCQYASGRPRSYEYADSHPHLQMLLQSIIDRGGRFPTAR